MIEYYVPVFHLSSTSLGPDRMTHLMDVFYWHLSVWGSAHGFAVKQSSRGGGTAHLLYEWYLLSIRLCASKSRFLVDEIEVLWRGDEGSSVWSTASTLLPNIPSSVSSWLLLCGDGKRISGWTNRDAEISAVRGLESEEEFTEDERWGSKDITRGSVTIAVDTGDVILSEILSEFEGLWGFLEGMCQPHLVPMALTSSGHDSVNANNQCNTIFECHRCQTHFLSPAMLIDHLNTEGVTCSNLDPAQHIPVPPAFMQEFGEDDVSGHYYPTSGYILYMTKGIPSSTAWRITSMSNPDSTNCTILFQTRVNGNWASSSHWTSHKRRWISSLSSNG